MLEMKIKAGRRSVVPGDLPSILGARRAYRELGDMVEALIAQMDMMAGDCDLEEDDLDQGVDDLGEGGFCYDIPPVYGVNQTRRWLNEQQMVKGGDAANERVFEMQYQACRARREIDLLDPSSLAAGASAELARRKGAAI